MKSDDIQSPVKCPGCITTLFLCGVTFSAQSRIAALSASLAPSSIPEMSKSIVSVQSGFISDIPPGQSLSSVGLATSQTSQGGLGYRALGRTAKKQGHECEWHEGCEALEHGHNRVCNPLVGWNYAHYKFHLQILSKKM